MGTPGALHVVAAGRARRRLGRCKLFWELAIVENRDQLVDGALLIHK